MFDGVDLYKKYPRILNGPLYPEVADGWLELVDCFLNDLQEASSCYKEGSVLVCDIKEKFGGMRIYVEYHLPDEQIVDLEHIVSKYEKLSVRTCCCCGDEDHKLHERRGYWDMVICESCYDKHLNKVYNGT